MTTRRGFLTGFVGFLAAPAIVRASSLMPLSGLKPKVFGVGFGAFDVTCITESMIENFDGSVEHWIKFVQIPILKSYGESTDLTPLFKMELE